MFVSIDHLELNTIFIEISPNNSLSRKASGHKEGTEPHRLSVANVI